MTRAPADFDNRAWASGRWLLVAAGVLTIGLGLIGWAQYRPEAGFSDLLYWSVSLFALSFEASTGQPIPLVLDAARFLAVICLVLAVGWIVSSVQGLLQGGRDRWRARRAKNHAVIVGTRPDVYDLAAAYAAARPPRGRGGKPVVLGDFKPAEAARLRACGAIALPLGARLAEVLEGSSQVVVAGETDYETMRLATLVASRPAESPDAVLLFDGREAAQLWGRQQRSTAVCRSVQLAIGCWRQLPPVVADRITPPPIIVGDGLLAAELVRHAVIGWQEPGEAMAVHCVGLDEAWAETAKAGLGGRGDIVFARLAAATGADAAQTVEQVLNDGKWRPPADPKRGQATGPTVIVALEEVDPAAAIAIGSAVSRQLGAAGARVGVVVPELSVGSGMAGLAGSGVRLIGRRELVADPGILTLTACQRLADQIRADAATWPLDVSTLFGSAGPIRAQAGVGGAAGGIDEALVARVADQAEAILAAGRVDVFGADPAPDELILLAPDELNSMARAVLHLAEGSPAVAALEPPARWVRALEFAWRLPTLAARAGWSPRRPAGYVSAVAPAKLLDQARQVHEVYLASAQATNNATNSANAGKSWEEVSAADQSSNRAQLLGVPLKLAAARLSWRKPAAKPQLYEFSAAQIELLAALEHRRWAQFAIRSGRSSHIYAQIDWAALSDDEKRYDLDTVTSLPQMLAGLGIEIYDPAPVPAEAR
ncbi:MAG: hypothetical protein LBD51_05680 [Bifidobacteriaceae bacterium]|jgi:hypothetical protein|nr:hypothetical protein [Bifidobacteriaceae bacterium]